MARFAGVDVPREKRIEIALTYVFGIGRPTAQRILTQCNVDWNKRTHQLNDDELAAIRAVIAELKLEGPLRSEMQMNIKRLMDVGCYRGLRHRKGLPVRGQNTKNNSRTRKGRKKNLMVKKKGK
ncbi:MAG: 30S ribosomal protein S13 [Calditrichaeota bacterium]|nr:30S ribosomal protein S13 [Calditrichota bacterium]MCB9366237.1 30S ribosomal protein S13 [Calditrichota bacterium]MCB9391694.1 30S ribosomal protein S13 [Calditrichota bacterium]